MSNWTKSFEDGIALLAILHYHDPSLVPNIHELVPNQTVDENLTRAWDIAEKSFDVPKLLELIDMKPPEMRSMQTYIIELHKRLSKVQRKTEGSSSPEESIEDQVDRLISTTKPTTVKPSVTSVTVRKPVSTTTPVTPAATAPTKEPTIAPVEPRTVEAPPKSETTAMSTSIVVPETATPTTKEEPKATVPESVVATPTVQDATTKPQDVASNSTIRNPQATAATESTQTTTTKEVPLSKLVTSTGTLTSTMFFATLIFALFAILIYKVAV